MKFLPHSGYDISNVKMYENPAVTIEIQQTLYARCQNGAGSIDQIISLPLLSSVRVTQ